MINQRKLIIMTKLAVYDKNQAHRDDKIQEYFLHDYIYRKNSYARFCALLGCLVLVLFRLMYEAFVEGQDVISSDLQSRLVGIGVFVAWVLVFYTIVSSVKAYLEFHKSETRRKNYLRLLRQLDNSRNSSPDVQAEEEEY